METTTGQTATMSQWTAPAAAVEIDLARVRAAIPRVAGQVNELIRSMPDVTIPIPGSAWSVGDAAAHLVVVFRAFTDAMEGRLEYWDARYGEGDIRTWARLAEGNARTLREVPHRHDPHALAGQLREGVQAFLAATTERSPDYAFRTPWYGQDRTRILGCVMCLVLGELVLHGHDIARGLRRPWPIDPDDARHIISGVFTHMIPLVVNPQSTKGRHMSYQLDVSGGPRFIVRFHDGRATVEPTGSRPVDCHLAGDPVTVLLFGYGRVGQWGKVAQGKLRAWGRKPWLGLSFKRFLINP
jgi:uncharacterized protein (TIGR03083 family)